MKIRLLFLNDPDPAMMPTVVAATDEYAIEDGGNDYWDDEKEAAVNGKFGPGEVREVELRVSDAYVRELFEPHNFPEFTLAMVKSDG